MLIRCITGGSFLTNSYIIADEETKEGILIDPGSQVDEVLEEIERLGLNVKRIVNTHCHIDHVAGAEEAKQALGADFYLHPKEEPVLRDIPNAVRRFPEFGNAKVPKIDRYIEEGDEIEIGKYTAKVIHTPGHTWGSICLIIDDQVFDGDVLFAGSVGRVDLTGGTSMRELIHSIKTKLMTLPPSYKVHPGHGPSTTIEIEKRSIHPYSGIYSFNMKQSFVVNILILTIGLTVVYLFAKEASHVYALYQENEKTKSRIEQIEKTNEELKKKIELLKNDNLYIEKMAREELGMIKQGEKIYRFEE
jgi:Zn-dependent hydrolases, including glyoxylases